MRLMRPLRPMAPGRSLGPLVLALAWLCTAGPANAAWLHLQSATGGLASANIAATCAA